MTFVFGMSWTTLVVDSVIYVGRSRAAPNPLSPSLFGRRTQTASLPPPLWRRWRRRRRLNHPLLSVFSFALGHSSWLEGGRGEGNHRFFFVLLLLLYSVGDPFHRKRADGEGKKQRRVTRKWLSTFHFCSGVGLGFGPTAAPPCPGGGRKETDGRGGRERRGASFLLLLLL